MSWPIAFDRLAFEAAQIARIGWFFGQKLLAARLAKPVPAPPELRGRAMPDRQRLIADLWRLIEQDWRNIEAGIYTAPEDWRGNPFAGLRQAVDFFTDLGAVEARRHGEAADVLLPEAEADRYPAYYRRKFHFQSDGYLSAASAERYDHQVEVLFGGGAAAMRRQALVPLREALRRWPSGADARSCSISAAAPAHSCARSSAIIRGSPSPGSTCRRPTWRWRGAGSLPWSRVGADRGGGRGDAVCRSAVRHRQLPLPVSRAAAARVRRAVVAEIRRVLKPGGTLIFVNSLQTGDEPDYDALLRLFSFCLS